MHFVKMIAVIVVILLNTEKYEDSRSFEKKMGMLVLGST